MYVYIYIYVYMYICIYRYGHVMIMADQDPDGSHIKGLLINLFHYYWPNLLKHPGFLQEFATPIVKARKKNGKTEIPFFTLQEYEEWRQEVGEGLPGWHIKYYKGLGTSSSQVRERERVTE